MRDIYQSRIAEAAPNAVQTFVARQPILDTSDHVFGYELLFRSGLQNFFPADTDRDLAASKVLLDSFLLIGMDVLLGGKRAFINFTRNLLVGDAALLFPAEYMVVEILENIEPDADVVAACKRLKDSGYLVALDDFVWKEELTPLVDLADIIKVDFTLTSESERYELVKRAGKGRNIRFLAEKVETKEEVAQARDMGYSLFQGYYFSRPSIIQGRDVPGYKLNYMQMLHEVSQPDVSFERVESIVKNDLSLTYKLLRFINSAAFSFQTKIESIRHALTLLGAREIRKWMYLVALSGMGQDKCEELVVSSLVRARFCELVAPRAGMQQMSSDLFLMGMFSQMDAFLDRPMSEIMSKLPISDNVKEALLGGEGRLRDVYELTVSYERAHWSQFSRFVSRLRLDEAETPRLFLQSLEMANQVFLDKNTK